MKHYPISVAVVAALLVASGCGDDSSSTAEPHQILVGDEAEDESVGYAAALFSDPTDIDNVWMPLTPGTRLVWEGTTLDDDEFLDHTVITIVTDLTKVIDGVETVVIWDQDFSDGELVETELAFFVQDDDGNVWRMGEYPEEYEDGEIVDGQTAAGDVFRRISPAGRGDVAGCVNKELVGRGTREAAEPDRESQEGGKINDDLELGQRSVARLAGGDG